MPVWSAGNFQAGIIRCAGTTGFSTTAGAPACAKTPRLVAFSFEFPNCTCIFPSLVAVLISINKTGCNKKMKAADFLMRPYKYFVLSKLYQCTSFQTRRLVKYISPAKINRKIITLRPVCLRISITGSDAHVKNVATSFAICSTLASVPSS